MSKIIDNQSLSDRNQKLEESSFQSSSQSSAQSTQKRTSTRSSRQTAKSSSVKTEWGEVLVAPILLIVTMLVSFLLMKS